MEITKDIPTLIKEYRRQAGVSLEVMARGLNMSAMTIRRWESGEFEPSPIYRKLLLDYIKENN